MTDELRKLAIAATPGPWTITYRASYYYYQIGSSTTRLFATTDATDFDAKPDQRLANAEYIAALDPATVIALCDCIDAADALRGEGYEPRPGVAKVERYDRARAALDRLTEKMG